MAGNESITSRKQAYLERLRKRYPDKSFDDDERIFSQTIDDYDDFEQRISRYEKDNKALSDLFAADPRSADFLVDMQNGTDPVLGLVKRFGVEIKDILDDPQMQDRIAEENMAYLERVAENRRLEDEYARNMDSTLDTLREFQQKCSLSDDDVDRVMELLIGIIRDGIVGKFAPATLGMALKALRYERDLADAEEVGVIAGRNAKITERLKKERKGDGIAPLAGKNSVPGERSSRKSMFDLAHEAM